MRTPSSPCSWSSPPRPSSSTARSGCSRISASAAPSPGSNDIRFARLWNLLTIGIFQKKIFRDPVAGPHARARSSGASSSSTAGTIELILARDHPALRLLELPAGRSPTSLLDLAGRLRRDRARRGALRALPPPRPPAQAAAGRRTHQGDAILILCMIGGLMVTMLLANAFDLVAGVAPLYDKPAVRSARAAPPRLTPPHAAFVARARILVVARAARAHLPELPAVLEAPARPRVAPQRLPLEHERAGEEGRDAASMDLEAEDAEQFGAADVDQLSWKNLFDGYSCTECGRCTSVCPANLTGKPLSPRKIIVNTRAAPHGEGAARWATADRARRR